MFRLLLRWRLISTLAAPLVTSPSVSSCRTPGPSSDQIAQVGGLARLGYIGLDEAETIIGHLKAFIEALVTGNSEERLVAVETTLRERGPPILDMTGAETQS